MNWHLVSYSDERFGDKSKEYQEFLHKQHKNLVHHKYNREWLEKTEFYQENKKVLDHKTGGLWAWKPFIIMDTLSKVNEGDFIIYCDRKDMFSPGIFNFVENILSEEECCLLLLGNNVNGHYTKRDTFILMDCDEDDYWNSKQLEAGFSIWRRCKKSFDILNEYLKYCLDYRVVSDEPSQLGEELDKFKEHKYDQSILTNIAIKEGLPVSNHEFRNYIECDYPYWYERGINGFGREIDKFLLEIKNA